MNREEIIEEIVNEIKVMPNDTEFTIGNLLMRYNDIINDDEVMELSLKIIGVLKEKNITIGSDRESGYIGGLPQNFKYKRIINPSQENKDNKQEIIQAIKNKENALKYIKNDKDVDVICDIICKPKENKDPFWYDMAKTLLKAIIYYLKNTDNENGSIQRCKEIVEKTITSDEPRKIMEELLIGFDNNSNVKNLYRPIEIAPEKTFLSIYNTLYECLNVVKTDKSFYKEELIIGIVDESEIEWKNNAINKIAKLENRVFSDIQCNERFFKEYNALELFVKGQRGGWIYLVSKDGSYLKFGEYALCKPEYLQEVLNEYKNGNRTGNIDEI